MNKPSLSEQHSRPSMIVPILVLMIQALFIFGLVSCSETEPETKQVLTSVHIEDHDECHLCGMVINQFSGPKGEMFEKNKSSVRKFCSVNDLFAYLLQPEIEHNIAKAFVHDMAAGPWKNTRETPMVDATKAWYVAGHKLRGAMGPALASFKLKSSAEAFVRSQGGHLLAYHDISLEVLNEAVHAQVEHGHDGMMHH